MEYLTSLHFSRLWRGAVFALRVNGVNKIVWYHYDHIDNFGYIHYTAIHNGSQYVYKPPYPDRWVWLRSNKPN